MAKTNVKGLSQFLDSMKAAISHLDEKFYLELADYVVARIQQKARSGKRMSQGETKDLPTLSEPYQKQRKEWKKEGRSDLDPLFSPSRKKSNLTVTGQYLRSLKATKVDRDSRTVTIEPTGRRKDGLTNIELAGYLADINQAYSIFGMDKPGRQALKTKVLNEIRKRLRKNLLRK